MLGESCVDVGDNGSLPQFSSFVPECFFVLRTIVPRQTYFIGDAFFRSFM